MADDRGTGRTRKAALKRLVRATRDVVAPPPESPPKPPKATQQGAKKPAERKLPSPVGSRYVIPNSFVVEPAPRPVPDEWPLPPTTTSAKRTERLLDPEDIVFDIKLFEQLNEEYASKPIVPKPPDVKARGIADHARERVSFVHRSIDLADKRVLEVGCGAGYEVWHAAHGLDAEGHGIDVVRWQSWPELEGDRVAFVQADFALENPYPDDHFDRIMSFTVWEHMRHPYRGLQEVYRVLKPGGLAWINTNLYRGANASHKYREVFFPWPHLLFTDEVFREFYRRQDMPPQGAAWVNKMTWAQYERYIDAIGFQKLMLSFNRIPIDEEFYSRFEDILGRYPRWDLETTFFTVVLRKPLRTRGGAGSTG